MLQGGTDPEQKKSTNVKYSGQNQLLQYIMTLVFGPHYLSRPMKACSHQSFPEKLNKAKIFSKMPPQNLSFML